MARVIEDFINRCDRARDITELPSVSVLEGVCQMVQGMDGSQFVETNSVTLIEKMTYFLIRDLKVNHEVLGAIDYIWGNIEDPLMFHRELVGKLKPNLPPIQKKISKNGKFQPINRGLNPQLSFNQNGENVMKLWLQRQSWKCYGLFYLVLSKIPSSEVSSSLNWIIPGILNLLDDTEDLKGIKLVGVVLLNKWLDCYGDDRWLQFSQIGIYDIIEPILFNMLHLVPPLYSMEDTLQIWEILYPTILHLYRVQFDGNKRKYDIQLQILISKNILQYSIPHCELKWDKLSEYQLVQLKELVVEIGESSVILVTRIIYTLGEILVKSPYITLFPNIMHAVLQVVQVLIEVVPEERITSHRFDIIGLVVILSKKCSEEGVQDAALVRRMVDIKDSLALDAGEVATLSKSYPSQLWQEAV